MLLTFLVALAISVALFPAVVRLPLPHSDTPALQYEWYHCLAYPVLSALAIAAVIAEGPVGPRALVQTPFALHIVWAQLGFFAAGLVLAATSSFPRLTESLIHHGVTLCTFGGLLLLGAFPSILLWVFVIQTTGVVFHPLRLLRRSGTGSPRLLTALEWTHLALFVALRLVAYSIATAIFLWRDHANPLFDSLVWEFLKYGVLFVYTALHVSWGSGLIRGRGTLPATGRGARSQRGAACDASRHSLPLGSPSSQGRPRPPNA